MRRSHEQVSRRRRRLWSLAAPSPLGDLTLYSLRLQVGRGIGLQSCSMSERCWSSFFGTIQSCKCSSHCSSWACSLSSSGLYKLSALLEVGRHVQLLELRIVKLSWAYCCIEKILGSIRALRIQGTMGLLKRQSKPWHRRNLTAGFKLSLFSCDVIRIIKLIEVVEVEDLWDSARAKLLVIECS